MKLLVLLAIITSTSADCTLDINNDMGYPYQPVLLQPGLAKFYNSVDNEGILKFKLGEHVEIFCPSEFQNEIAPGEKLIDVTCFTNDKFEYQVKGTDKKIYYDMNQFICHDWPTFEAKQQTPTVNCHKNGVLVDVGFKVAEDRFVSSYTSCHDPLLAANYYVHYVMTPNIFGYAKTPKDEFPFPGWTKGGFYRQVDLQRDYGFDWQKSAFMKNKDHYISAGRFFAKGHLAPKKEFITINEQRSTYEFINAAPQWQNFKTGNWEDLEFLTRKRAAFGGANLEVFTGTLAPMKLENANGVKTEILLDEGRLPVPAQFFKIVIDRTNNVGVAFVGINNPFLTPIESSMEMICPPGVQGEITSIDWHKLNEDYSRGYIYACEVKDFIRKAMLNIPGVQYEHLGLMTTGFNLPEDKKIVQATE